MSNRDLNQRPTSHIFPGRSLFYFLGRIFFLEGHYFYFQVALRSPRPPPPPDNAGYCYWLESSCSFRVRAQPGEVQGLGERGRPLAPRGMLGRWVLAIISVPASIIIICAKWGELIAPPFWRQLYTQTVIFVPAINSFCMRRINCKRVLSYLTCLQLIHF